MEDFKDLSFADAPTYEEVKNLIQEKLGISIDEMTVAICKYVSLHSEEMALQLPNIAPYADYAKLLEDNDSMAEFLKNEAVKVENWKLFEIKPDSHNDKLLQFSFSCTAVDDGNTVIGFVYISPSGKIRHAFACYQD